MSIDHMTDQADCYSQPINNNHRNTRFLSCLFDDETNVRSVGIFNEHAVSVLFQENRSDLAALYLRLQAAQSLTSSGKIIYEWLFHGA